MKLVRHLLTLNKATCNIKKFSDSQAAILALNSNTLTSSLVKQTIINLNLLADSTKRVEICWIKAHIGHDGNERADQLAREAVKNSQIKINTPQSWSCYKAQLKQEIYSEWEQRWINDNAYRMTNIFYPKPDSNKANLVRVAPDCNRSYCEDSFSGYSGSV